MKSELDEPQQFFPRRPILLKCRTTTDWASLQLNSLHLIRKTVSYNTCPCVRFLSAHSSTHPNSAVGAMRLRPAVDQAGLVHWLCTPHGICGPSDPSPWLTCWVKRHRWHWFVLVKNTLMSFQSFWKSSCWGKRQWHQRESGKTWFQENVLFITLRFCTPTRIKSYLWIFSKKKYMVGNSKCITALKGNLAKSTLKKI